MKPREAKIGIQVTHVINDEKTGIITGILKPDEQGIRVCWENLNVSWHFPSELEPRPPKAQPIGFKK